MPPTDTAPEIAALQRQLFELGSKLAEARRNAPHEPVEDYILRDPDGAEVTLASLFGDKGELLVVHNMGESCPYCTLWADGLNGVTDHLNSRAAFVLCSADDPATLKAFAASRGWRFRTVSGAGSAFAKDMGYEVGGKPHPGVSAFQRKGDGTIVRTGTAPFGPGDQFCALWHLFDLLPGGPGDWQPKYQY